MEVDFINQDGYTLTNQKCGENWDLPLDHLEDFSDLLDIEANISPDEFIGNLPDDLELPMVQDDPMVDSMAEALSLSDGSSDSGVECLSMKHEPLSPASLNSDGSNDSLHSQTLIDNGYTTFPPSPDFSDVMIDDPLLAPQIYHPPIKAEPLPDTPPTTPVNQHGLYTATPTNAVNQQNLTAITTVAHMVPGSVAPRTPQTKTVKIVSKGGANNINGIKLVFPNQSSASSAPIVAQPLTSAGTVVCSKAKIQPRPSLVATPPGVDKPLNLTKITTAQAGPVSSAVVNGTSGQSGKPLVLTPEAFAKLTAQGVLKFNPPTSSSSVTDVKPDISDLQPMVTDVKPMITAPTHQKTIMGSASSPIDCDTKQLKRQQRMIKNRESACLSRKRKKEYLQSLEEKLAGAARENEKLKNENLNLKRKINVLSSENECLKKRIVPPAKKLGVVVLGIMLFFSLNFTPISNIFTPHSSTNNNGDPLLTSLPSDSVHHGRTLMSVSEPENNSERSTNTLAGPYLDNLLEEIKSLAQYQNPKFGTVRDNSFLERAALKAMCPSFYNSTDSQRLVNELTGWISGHKEELRKTQEKEEKKKGKKKKVYPSPRKLKAAMRGDFQHFQEQPNSHYEMAVYSGGDKTYNDFIDKIQRRNDTIYVVSFRKDHLLLPATATNKTMGRPKMSLVMPALGLNSTMQPSEGNVMMMQIDCEVTDTKLVELDRAAIPRHLQENQTNYNTYQGRKPGAKPTHLPRRNDD